MIKLGLFVVVAALLFGCSEQSAYQQPQNLWEGSWLRVDGTYQLIVEQPTEGVYSATYLNPSPVNVQKVEVQLQDNRELLIVILNDVGYPGAVYDLVFSPTADRLVGTYANPNADQTYQVSFTRQR